jgi:hypothetical protein
VADENSILELSGLVPDRPKARLRWPENPDGLQVELAVREDFGIFDHAELERLRAELARLATKRAPTPDEKNRAADILDSLAERLVIGAPQEALDALPESAKEKVVESFFASFLSQEDSRALRLIREMNPETLTELGRLVNSSPDSSVSTAATPSSGGE